MLIRCLLDCLWVMFHRRHCDVFALFEIAHVRERDKINWKVDIWSTNKKAFCLLGSGTETLALLRQTLARYMKSLWTQFNFCQQSGSAATMDFFYALPSDSHRASVWAGNTESVWPTPSPPPRNASALKVHFIHIENEVISELRPIVSLAQGKAL